MKRREMFVCLCLAMLCFLYSCLPPQSQPSTSQAVFVPLPVCDPDTQPNTQEENTHVFRAYTNDYLDTGLSLSVFTQSLGDAVAHCALPVFSSSFLDQSWKEQAIKELEGLSLKSKTLRADFETEKIKDYVLLTAVYETQDQDGWQEGARTNAYWDPSRKEFLQFSSLWEGFGEFSLYFGDYLRTECEKDDKKDAVDLEKLESFLVGEISFSSFVLEEEGVWVTLDESNVLQEGQSLQLWIPDCYFDGSIIDKISNRWKEYTPVQPGEKVIALTFDDGPSTANTTRILNVLEENHAKATFFVAGHRIGRSTGAVLRRIVDLGSQIGNHSYSHANLSLLTPEEMMEEIGRTQEAVYAATGTYPTCLRPPYGSLRSELVSQTGMYAVLWNVDTLDWQHKNTQTLIDTVLAGASSGDVILMHDIHTSTVDGVEAIVKGLQEQGFRLVTVEEMFDLKNQEPQGKKYYSQGSVR